MLTADDPVVPRPQRILIAGVSGVGKTTFARRLAAITGIRHTEIDALFHGAGWTRRPTFEADVATLTAAEEWITEWQYGSVRDLLAQRADTLIWLDAPTRVALSRVLRRTLRRRRTREVLWNGNREPPLRTVFTDRDHIITWAIRTRHKYRAAVPLLEHARPRLRIVRLRTQRDVEAWLASVRRW